MDTHLAVAVTACSVLGTPLPAPRTAFSGRLPAHLELGYSETPLRRMVKQQACMGRPSTGSEWAARPLPLPGAPRTAFGATASAPAGSVWRVMRTPLPASRMACWDKVSAQT